MDIFNLGTSLHIPKWKIELYHGPQMAEEVELHLETIDDVFKDMQTGSVGYKVYTNKYDFYKIFSNGIVIRMGGIEIK